MSVRNALLALVAQQPAGVYRLKQMFEEQTCGAWPLNIGQVYQTMQRLERDGQVVSHAETNAGRDSEVFELTDAGRDVLTAWWSTPVPREHPERDELVMKLAVAAADPTVDVEAMIQTQRRSTLGSLRDVTRLKASADEGELAWKLILERHIFDLEAELNWLDHIESGAVSEAARRAAFAAAKGRSGGSRHFGACRGAMSQPAPLPIRMTGVGHEFGANGVRVRALDGIDLEVAPGELLAVMGPSGSGKSTLLSIAGGLERPTHGSVYVNGVDLATLDSVHRAEVRRRSIGYVFQDYNLIPSLSALENVEMPLQLDGVSPSKVREAAMAALEEVGVAELADRFPERLSGGQRQRVAIARGLVGNRSVILADEPTGALDSHTGEQIMLVLRDHIDAGAAGILVTHEARMAAWADRTVFLRDGRIVDRSHGDSLRDLLADTAPGI